MIIVCCFWYGYFLHLFLLVAVVFYFLLLLLLMISVYYYYKRMKMDDMVLLLLLLLTVSLLFPSTRMNVWSFLLSSYPIPSHIRVQYILVAYIVLHGMICIITIDITLTLAVVIVDSVNSPPSSGCNYTYK